MTLIAYTSDLHGYLPFYAQFLELARSRQAQAAVLGGDLLPHTSSRAEALARQRHFIAEQLRPLLEQHLAAGGPPVYAIPGNDDWAAAIDELQGLADAGLIYPLHMRALPLGEHYIAGYACVPLTPFSIKDWERPEEEQQRSYSFALALHSAGGSISSLSEREFRARPSIGRELEALAQQSDPTRTIYVCHTPPYQTGIDLTRLRRSVGSHDLRSFIERHQPPLTLHGHIHEGPEMCGRYAARLGHTWCLNPGQSSRLHAIVVDPANLPAGLWHTELGQAEA